MNCKFCNKETQDKLKNIECCKECRPLIYKKRDEMVEKKKELFEAAHGIGSGNDPGPLTEYLKSHDGTIKRAMIMLAEDKQEDKQSKEK